MATAAQNPSLPLFYRDLVPLNLRDHGAMKLRRATDMGNIGVTHAVPLTIDEFSLAQRDFPIVFSVGDQSVPIALMGLNEGVNTFLTEEGRMREPGTYVPAYIRRYPFMLAKVNPQGDDLSLCFDPNAQAVGDFEDGQALFDGEKPTEEVQAVLEFCEQFESAGMRTQAFMTELKELGLLMEGEVAIQPQGFDQPFVYRGFLMVDEEKFRELRGDTLRKMNQNGMLSLIFAHLFSLGQMREVFARQLDQGKTPGISAPQAADADKAAKGGKGKEAKAEA